MKVVISNSRKDFIDWCIENRISKEQAKKEFINPHTKEDLCGFRVTEIIDISYYNGDSRVYQIVEDLKRVAEIRLYLDKP